MVSNSREAFPEGREWLGGPPGGLRVVGMVGRPSRRPEEVGRPSRRAESGRETLSLSVGRERSEGPTGQSKVVGNGWEANPKGR